MKSGNFGYLFAGLLAVLLAMPFSSNLPGGGRYSVTLLFCFFMLISVWSLAASKRVFQFGILLVVAISSLVGVNIVFGVSYHLQIIESLLITVFCALSCFIAARNVFIWHRVDLNSLVGAFCVYLLLGLMWALLFRILQICGWASFTGNISEQPDKVFPDLVYFSFVTIASLGYGDISPIGGLPKMLAYLEALIGQFYLAVMVASLVGVYSAGRKRQ
ncbi:potassium channel family protein [Methylomonas rapida]|uniref:Potassium channel family protein n=1 Tax=Methylomonas rapida TaxID=2963939 RepID=A0ABY7GCZ9_9GAMM|nr:potassium channel family protein [Methylomonas rapida]WAR43167.1 potassium channel family protein [Methylomonas rapida]